MNYTLNLQGKIILLVCSVVLLALLTTNWLISAHVAKGITDQKGRSVMDIARIVAHSEVVAEGLAGLRDEKDMQDYSKVMRSLTNTAIVVVFDMQGIRKSHPNESLVGYHVVGGDEQPALQGKEYLSYASGTVGPQLRAFTPVYHNGQQVGGVVVSIHLGDVEQAVRESRNRIFFAILLGMAIGITGAVLLARSIKKTLFGLEPAGIAKLLEERNAMLQSVREGILAVDLTGKITLANDAAIAILHSAGTTGNPIGQEIEGYIPNTGLRRVMAQGLTELNQEQDINGVRIITNRVPIHVNDTIVGAIATFRDKTEINKLAEELTGVRGYVDALRSQTHEFMNKLHVILGLVRLECYDQLAAYINRIANDQEAEVAFVGKRIREPAVAGLVLSKLSRSREMGVSMTIDEDTLMTAETAATANYELITILGNLLDNALEAAESSDAKIVTLSISETDEECIIQVADSGPGLAQAVKERIFERGFSTKGENRGFGLHLVESCIKKLEGTIEFNNSSPGTEVIVTIPRHREEIRND